MAANTSLTTKTIFAPLLAIGIAGSAQAQAPSTFSITGHAPGQQVGSIVGGGTGASLQGGGDDLVIRYISPVPAAAGWGGSNPDGSPASPARTATGCWWSTPPPALLGPAAGRG